MQLKTEQGKFTFQLVDIIVPHFSVSIPADIKLPENSSKKQFPIEIGTGVHFNEKEKLIIINLHVKVFINDQKEQLLSEIVTQTVYEIENFEEVVEKKSPNEYVSPDIMLHTLVGISLSTTRGIFLEKNSGNFLHKIFIPIVKPGDLLKNKNNKK